MTGITQSSKVSIGLILAIIPLVAGAWAWYDGRQDAEHKELAAEATAQVNHVDYEQHASNVELDLRLVEVELKQLRTIKERRPLTDDENDRKSYLEERRRILMAEQRKKANA